jgi:hypothetical protein
MNVPRILRPFRLRWVLGVCLGLGAVLARPAAAQETNRPVRPDYAAFKIVTDRNIFNANRSGGTPRPSREGRNPNRMEFFRLVGIMDYDRGTFAFFDGTSSEYKKALQSQGKIAGYTLTNVAPDKVTLDAEGKQVELHVGMRVQREDNGEWQPDTSNEAPAAPAGSPASSDSGGDDSGGEVSDVLKRLMQQREKE